MSWLENKIESIDDPGAPTTPTRALDTSFQPSTTKHALCMYTIEMNCDTTESCVVELRSDAADPPTTVRASTKLLPTLTGGGSVIARQQMTYIVPPGHYVKLVNTATGVSTIAHQTEMVVS